MKPKRRVVAILGRQGSPAKAITPISFKIVYSDAQEGEWRDIRTRDRLEEHLHARRHLSFKSE
jgi:hypothetical protein